MLCKILIDYSPAEGWKVGDIVDITDPSKLIYESKVEEVTGKVEVKKVEVKQEKEKKEYICTICGYVANTGAGLKSHMRKHNA